MKAVKTKSGKWRVRVYLGKIDGKARWQSITKETKQEALRAAALYKPADDGTLSVAEAAERYIDIKEAVLSPATVRGYDKILRCHIQPNKMGSCPLSKLNSANVQEWVSGLAKNLSPKSVRNCYGFFTAVVMMFLPDARFRVKLPQRQTPQQYIPTTADVNAIIAASDPEMKKAIGLAICAMMRRGEICALNASDVNFLLGTVHISKAVAKDKSGKWVIKPPKTESSERTVSINRELLNMLPKNGKIVDLRPDQISMRFNRALTAAGLPSFRFHDLRHYAASIAVSSAIGAGRLTIQDRGGWQSDHVLKNVYEHSVQEQKDRDTASILSFYSKNISFTGGKKSQKKVNSC